MAHFFKTDLSEAVKAKSKVPKCIADPHHYIGQFLHTRAASERDLTDRNDSLNRKERMTLRRIDRRRQRVIEELEAVQVRTVNLDILENRRSSNPQKAPIKDIEIDSIPRRNRSMTQPTSVYHNNTHKIPRRKISSDHSLPPLIVQKQEVIDSKVPDVQCCPDPRKRRVSQHERYRRDAVKYESCQSESRRAEANPILPSQPCANLRKISLPQLPASSFRKLRPQQQMLPPISKSSDTRPIGGNINNVNWFTRKSRYYYPMTSLTASLDQYNSSLAINANTKKRLNDAKRITTVLSNIQFLREFEPADDSESIESGPSIGKTSIGNNLCEETQPANSDGKAAVQETEEKSTMNVIDILQLENRPRSFSEPP
ncbi:uncharacterized protein LOC141905525 [Tubulanus polymorphus]|uniref:uncharacterized protein LOC141905525 n=1 Tax=Tubulanus polymorphus TaxID=672921 RepID=UPI003DA6A50F